MRGYENAVLLRGERRMLSLQVVSLVTKRTYRQGEETQRNGNGRRGPPSILHFPLYTGVGGIVQQTDLLAANAVHFPESRRPSGLNQSVCSSFVTAAPLQIIVTVVTVVSSSKAYR